MGFAQVVQLNPVEGFQLYVPLPVAVSVVLEPEHIETSGPAIAVGRGFTVTDTTASSIHPFPSVMVTV